MAKATTTRGGAKAAVKKAAAKAPAKKAAAKKAVKKPAQKAAKKATFKPDAPKVAVRPAKTSARKPGRKSAPKVAVTPAPSAPVDEGLTTPERPQVDPAALEAWRSMPEEQRAALREREAMRAFQAAAEHHRARRLDDAVKGYGKALMLNPRIPDVYNNLGVALRAQGKLEASIACYRRALALRPNNSGVYSNMGNALRELGRLEVAKASHQQAVKLAPTSPEAFYNLGLVLRDLGESDAAMSCFDRTLALNPDHVDCHWDRSLALLQKGELKDGFDEYEWRWKLERSPPRDYEQPEWDGGDFKGKTLLVHQEQGFGDMIQFARFLPMVKAKGGTVVVEAQPELASLFSTLDGVDKVVDKGAELPAFDLYVPMLSLGRVLGIDLDSIPADMPYMRPPELHPVQLPASLGRIKKVGISWAGKPTHQNDRNRSCPFNHFVDLLGLAGMTVFSLQKGPRVAEVAEAGAEALVTDIGTRLGDFADTAAVIEQLDLIITVDTALAHLAGALGKPVWVVLPYSPDWRWMLSRRDSPWYPSMRLFRQRRFGAWGPVFVDIRRALRDDFLGN